MSVKCIFFQNGKCTNNQVDTLCNKNICCKLCQNRKSGLCEIYCVAWEWD